MDFKLEKLDLVTAITPEPPPTQKKRKAKADQYNRPKQTNTSWMD